ncbi:formate dehydrogenase subunit delta [uncultured Phenylobacterium sp.]|uniref:formate dehydrogenase subunit delta n=1 Tax=uncultured Phenylobacterium sp. TaxID=349273 RepID=UPI0025E4C469|nr:formate dehydrogenase subunit delta [uncultured Phenylobacterium sp.]
MSLSQEARRPERLIYMANQIAKFFAAQPGDPADGVANHLRSFWDPQMRADIVAWRAAGGDGLDPIAGEAVGRLG